MKYTHWASRKLCEIINPSNSSLDTAKLFVNVSGSRSSWSLISVVPQCLSDVTFGICLNFTGNLWLPERPLTDMIRHEVLEQVPFVGTTLRLISKLDLSKPDLSEPLARKSTAITQRHSQVAWGFDP